jgi:hypothetical protein
MAVEAGSEPYCVFVCFVFCVLCSCESTIATPERMFLIVKKGHQDYE